MAKKRTPLQQRAPPAPDFNEEKRQNDSMNIERHMANFFADLSKTNNADITTTTISINSAQQDGIKD